MTACPDSITVKIVQQYLSLPEDSAERFALQNKYGKGVVLKLVADYLEEQQNKKWISASTTPCPGCETAIEKSIGCNHVRVHILQYGRSSFVILRPISDDVCKMPTTLLLSVWNPTQP